MALPTSVETERTLYLNKILQSVPPEQLVDWPMPTRTDFALIGKIVVTYSFIDFYLLRLIEIYEKAGQLPEKWKGKTEKMPIVTVGEVIAERPDWAPANLTAFKTISEFRKIRNLMAHFAVKRFPNEDAFLFLTKSASDFKKVLGVSPEPGMAMTGVVDIGHTAKIYKVIERLLTWLSQATRQVEDQYFESLKRG
jgi:hypothetical protein